MRRRRIHAAPLRRNSSDVDEFEDSDDESDDDDFVIDNINEIRNFIRQEIGDVGLQPQIQCFDVETVKENMKHHTKRQISNAKRARELQVSLGCTTDALKMITRQRFIEDNPVTAEHVDLAERIFGPDVAALKGKRTRRQPGALIDDQIQIPKEIYELCTSKTQVGN